MSNLIFGVENVPHLFDGVMAIDVALDLESKYKLFSTFFSVNDAYIAEQVATSMVDTFSQNIKTGINTPVFAQAESNIAHTFRVFLSSKAAEGVGIKGTPTHAALMGWSSRLSDYTGIRRPSFIDTGITMNAFGVKFLSDDEYSQSLKDTVQSIYNSPNQVGLENKIDELLALSGGW